jgi:hypothetical protein
LQWKIKQSFKDNKDKADELSLIKINPAVRAQAKASQDTTLQSVMGIFNCEDSLTLFTRFTTSYKMKYLNL